MDAPRSRRLSEFAGYKQIVDKYTASAVYLSTMIAKGKIKDMSEAFLARKRLEHTRLKIASLHKEIRGQDVSERELPDREREIDRLRVRYKSEIELLDNFYKGFELKSSEYERLLELKDPGVERMRGEMNQVLELKRENETEEIMRIREEFARRFEELVRE